MFAIADVAPSEALPAAVIQQVPRGTLTRRQLAGHEYFLYVPHSADEGAPVLVSVHGISRNAHSHAAAFAAFADRYGVVLVAPRFSKQQFPGYQRLGISRRGVGPRPDLALNAILSEVAAVTGAHTERFYLFGYSGGGQFAHRYAIAHPQRVISVAMGAPGWYTFPDRQARYPRGLDLPPGQALSRAELREILQIPMAVFVGEHDNQRDEALRQTPGIDAQQGMTRVERGRRWIDAMQLAAARYGYDTRYCFRVLEDCDHSFSRCMQHGDMGWHVFEFLFGPRAGRRIPPLSHDPINNPFLVFCAA